MLETEVQKQKTENSRLRLEVTWIRGTIDKLQKENDQLRLELVLCKEGIKPRRTQDSIKETSTMPASSLSNCAVATTAITAAATIDVQTSSLSPPSLDGGCMAFGHSDQSSTSSHSPNSSNPSPPPLITDDFVEPWDFVLPDQNYQLTRPQNTYLSYAVMPEWDLPNILDKGSETTALMPANQLIQRYPLLVPALMSIILGHTMTMTAEELVSHTKLLTSPSPLLVPLDESCEDGHLASHHSVNAFWFGPKPIKSNKATKIPTGEELHSIWEAQQLRREMSLETWYNEKADEQHQVAQTAPDYCPLTWLQKQFCRFVYAQIISRYPQLEQPCKVYLPICDKIIQRTTPLSG
ncbi:hypothetical protein BX666DRAFT_1598700 [Dichotomocladium elegans]|nr:hypothetical protein BX666DRAFT_1598700 [Dichotomocladium elegans]